MVPANPTKWFPTKVEPGARAFSGMEQHPGDGRASTQESSKEPQSLRMELVRERKHPTRCKQFIRSVLERRPLSGPWASPWTFDGPHQHSTLHAMFDFAGPTSPLGMAASVATGHLELHAMLFPKLKSLGLGRCLLGEGAAINEFPFVRVQQHLPLFLSLCPWDPKHFAGELRVLQPGLSKDPLLDQLRKGLCGQSGW